MFYTGVDPLTMEEVYIPKTKEEKAMQRALLQFKNPKKYDIVYDALVKAGREDLIGNGPKCLIPSKEDRYRAKMGYQKGKGSSQQTSKQQSGKQQGTSQKNKSKSSYKGQNSTKVTKGQKSGMKNAKSSKGKSKR